MSNDIEDLKAKLAEALKATPLNYSQVLSLANEIAKHDAGHIRFSVDASHISRLGIELVSKQETAVAELIKNAFDSDATLVTVTFSNTDTPGGQLEISDDGHGMSRQELVNGFMRISTQEKVSNPLSTKFGRQRAGRKGIGRFAAQRLGNSLAIVTRREEDDMGLSVSIDWNLFEGGKDLFLVANEINKIDKDLVGTTLFIRGVRDSWSEAQIQRAYRYISSLLQPFPLNKVVKEKGADPGFKVLIQHSKNGKLIPIAGEEQSIFPHALAKFSGRVNDNGTAYVSVESKKFSIDVERPIDEFDVRVKQKPDVPQYAELSGIRFNAYYFITDELPSGTRTMVRDLLNAHGGIRVYRNGFRVLPYGEQFDDWLGMQRSSALREILPPHHNTNFLGFVEISDVSGEHFEETASREGLLENAAFTQLQDFVYRGLMAGVLEIARARKRKLYASDPSPKKDGAGELTKKSAHEIASELRDIVNKVETSAGTQTAPVVPGDHIQDLFQKAAPVPPAAPAPDLSPLDAVKELANQIEALGAESELLLEENGMLRVLASLGLTIGEFTHEVRHTLAGLNSAITSLSIRTDKDGQSLPESESLKKNVQLLQSYVRYFDDAVTQNAHRKLEAHEIRDLIGDFSEMIGPTLKRQGVTLEVDVKGYDLFTKPMHRSEWASIFLNLFTNSLKAIHRAGVKGKILINAYADGDFLRIDFSDNGDGIPEENRGKIFDAFFTTSSVSKALAKDSEKLLGTGLGLKIVYDILDAAHGDIEVVPAAAGYSTCFRIDVPRATAEEINNDNY